ncbi:MAG: ATP-dependent Clp protease adaptor ClpS [Phycisphaerales bacterium JB038]
MAMERIDPQIVNQEGPDGPKEGGGAAVADAPPAPTKAPRRAPTPTPTRTPPRQLPQWRVLLHNDEVNEIGYVVQTVFSLTPLNQHEAIRRTLEAHHRGLTLLLVTHRERAELYVEQFRSKRLKVTIEPAS